MTTQLLLACSDPPRRRQYRRLFSSCGLQVFTAADGVDCLAQLRRVAPHLLVLDAELRWGGSDGVIACLREDETLPRMPVIVLRPAAEQSAPPNFAAVASHANGKPAAANQPRRRILDETAFWCWDL